METYRDILQHHGIKGQRWGVRKERNEDRSSDGSSKKRKKLVKRIAIGAALIGGISLGVYLNNKATKGIIAMGKESIGDSILKEDLKALSKERGVSGSQAIDTYLKTKSESAKAKSRKISNKINYLRGEKRRSDIRTDIKSDAFNEAMKDIARQKLKKDGWR